MIFIRGNTPSSKNSKVWTGKFLVSSKAVTKWKKESKGDWEGNKDMFLDKVDDETLPLHIEFTFIRKSKHKFDYINALQVVADEMVRYGYIEDDNADILLPSFAPYRYDKLNPGVEIRVL